MNAKPTESNKTPFIQIEQPQQSSQWLSIVGGILTLAVLGIRLALFLSHFSGSR